MMIDGLRVEIVPDDDAEAHPSIPNDVLENLKPDTALIGFHMMYVRASLWEKMKVKFDGILERKPAPEGQGHGGR